MAKDDIWSMLMPPALQQQGPMMTPLLPQQMAMNMPQQPQIPVQQSRSSSSSAQIPVVSPRTSAPKYEEQFDDAFMTSMDERKRAIEALQGKLGEAQANAPTGINALDLKPFLMFSDQLMGTKDSYAYNGNSAVKDNKDLVSKLQERIGTDQNKMSDDQLGYLKLRAQEESLKLREANAARQFARGNEGEESRTRREYLANPAIKGMNDVDAAYRTISTNPGNTGPDQQAFVYQFSKLLDPGSVVRETEYAMSAANAGKLNQMSQWVNKFNSGTPLTPQQIQDMKDVANNIMKSYRQKVDGVNKYYGGIAQRKGFDPRNVIADTYQTATVSPEDQQALEWANANPNDGRAKAIKQRLGAK